MESTTGNRAHTRAGSVVNLNKDYVDKEIGRWGSGRSRRRRQGNQLESLVGQAPRLRFSGNDGGQEIEAGGLWRVRDQPISMGS
jgi:hypothetical protein